MINYSRNYVRKIINLVLTVPKWMIYFYHTNLSHEVPLSFVWLNFSSFGWENDMRRIRSSKTLSLGIPKAPQGNIQGRPKCLSLGMPRVAPLLDTCTNHTRKRARSRTETHGKISQHNSKLKFKHKSSYYNPGVTRTRIHKSYNHNIWVQT